MGGCDASHTNVCRYNGEEHFFEGKRPRKVLESSGPGTELWQTQSGSSATSTAGWRQDADTDDRQQQPTKEWNQLAKWLDSPASQETQLGRRIKSAEEG